MGTRSTYRIMEEWREDGKLYQKEICLIYRQYDGYPNGHPLQTAEWLSNGTVVNGLSMDEDRLVFNGAGCLAAQLIAEFKDGPGGTYIHSINSRGQCNEDYLYDIVVKDDRSIEYVCYENGYGTKKPKELFRGSPANFVNKYNKVEA